MSLPHLHGFPVPSLSGEQIASLEEAARLARIDAVTMVAAANSGHPGGAFSSMEMFLSVYGVANLTPENCGSSDRDYVVVSHGHTSAGVYAALAAWGFFDAEEAVSHFRSCGSVFQGHVERDIPGVDWGTGNLGQGLSAGVGFALAQRARGCKGRTYVLMGDGGQTKGQLAEARRMAVKEELENLVALVDWNGIQISGNLDAVMPCNLEALWEADGWEVLECDGHSFQALYGALRGAGSGGRPTVLLCRTVMGKNGGAMEGTHEYHGKSPKKDVYEQVIEGLRGDPGVLGRALELRSAPFRFTGRKVEPLVPSLDLGNAFTYDGAKTDNRGAFGRALADVGRLNCGKEGRTPLLVFDCDLAPSVMTEEFRRACPSGFVQCGIQEHSTATASGAAAAAGVVSVWADFGVFGIDEVYNQQRLNDINHAGNKTVLTHVGLDVGEDGKTHQCIDYVGLLRNNFGWKLVVPADPNQTDRATRWMLGTPGCICLAMGRSKVEAVVDAHGDPVFAGDYRFEYGRVVRVRQGTMGTIFALGAMTQKALAAAELLAGRGIDVSVWSVSCPLEVDRAALGEACASGYVLTVEDHHAGSGMGAVMALEMVRGGFLASASAPVRFEAMGVTRYGDSGPAAEVYRAMGLSPEGIAETFARLRG